MLQISKKNKETDKTEESATCNETQSRKNKSRKNKASKKQVSEKTLLARLALPFNG
jgi:hypothetical protein